MSNYKYESKYLKPLNKQRLLKDFTVFDIETNEWLDNLENVDQSIIEEYHNRPIEAFLLVFYDGSELLYYSGKDCLYRFLRDYLVKRNRGRICFSHNGGKFDILALYQCFREHSYFLKNFTYQPVMQGSRIMSFKIYDKFNHKWEFRDSFSLLPRSLNYLCESFKPDHVKLERPSCCYENDRPLWNRYCANDCLALYDILKTFNDTIADVKGCVGYTIASTSLLTFRRRFLNRNLSTYHRYNHFFRNAYYGGRTEIFNMYAQKHESPFYLYDINSLYPFVMRNNVFPVSVPHKVNYCSVDECFNKTGIMECIVSAPFDLYMPILPYHRDDGKLLFPLGSWKGVYEFSLIEKAVMMGYDIKPLRSWEFESGYLFKDFVDHFYRLKTVSDGAEKEIYKLLLNSLYGKWGEKPDRRRLITDKYKSLEGLLPFDTLFGYALEKYTQNSPHHLPCISIRVTALAQLCLYKLFEEVFRRGGKIFYCDTDSIVTNIRLPTSKDIGDINLEDTFEEGIFLLPKTYIIKSFDSDKDGNRLRIKCKGFSKGIKRSVNDFEIWKKALMDKDFSLFHEQKIRPASLNEIRIRHLNGFVTLLENKSIKSFYDKRIVEKDFDTKPIVL